MTEMEIRALNEHTIALENHTSAMRHFCSLIETILEMPNGGAANLVSLVSRMQETAYQFHTDARSLSESAETISQVGNIVSTNVDELQEISRRTQNSAEIMNEVSRQQNNAATTMQEAADTMSRAAYNMGRY